MSGQQSNACQTFDFTFMGPPQVAHYPKSVAKLGKISNGQK